MPCTSGADPVVRSAPDGLFYFSGITFNRGTNLGQVFVARYLDRNDKENGDATRARDPIQYLDVKVVDTGTSGRFLDKPWTAVDVPRAGSGTCTLPTSPTRTVPAGTLYLVYADREAAGPGARRLVDIIRQKVAESGAAGLT
jgi:hypothetical protein